VIDLDRASLDLILPPEPEPAGWDDVMSRSRAHQSRRRRRLVALGAVALLLVMTATAFGVRALVLDKGFIGVPPDGATPSTPESGELVLSYIGGPAATEGNLFKAFLYADGRLIWDQEGHFEGGKGRTGFLEQRLTPEGVELLLSEVLATGLFDHDVRLVRSGVSHIPNWAGISVRNGNRLVTVDFGGAWGVGDHVPTQEPTPEQESAIERLGARLVDPGSWLPPSAWENREIRAYVGSRYDVCVYMEPSMGMPTYAYGNAQPLELSEILTVIPAAAADLLREEFTGMGGTLADGRIPVNGYCSDVTTEKAQAIGKALDAAGLPWAFPGSVQSYRFYPPVPEDGIPTVVVISLQTYLPHGETICQGCG
jgi:hypothetical protein